MEGELGRSRALFRKRMARLARVVFE
jgi:hypothetical protein